ncbi:MAG: DUF11 domain-containing protein [Anaerolineae bacterium]|nr:DUF11 domain-containing protein [Anaerolineae bacterium]
MMKNLPQSIAKSFRLSVAVFGGVLLLAALMLALHNAPAVYADPIEPPAGYPKLSLSTKAVTPTLANVGETALHYTIEIVNTGAYTAEGVTLADLLPANTTYNDDAWASVLPQPNVAGGVLTWMGDVGFDATVVVTFSVTTLSAFEGTVQNTAVISHPLIAQPITMTAETVVTDDPILVIEKISVPDIPGAGGPISYTLVVANWGQPAVNTPITVTDWVPLSTTLNSVGIDGATDPLSTVVTWTRNVTMALGEQETFVFSVNVDEDVVSGTVIANAIYHVDSVATGIVPGELYTVTVLDPILILDKYVWPDPPGSNREMTYTLGVLNVGALATNMVITDRVPAGTEYRRGGTEAGGIVSWTLPSLGTGEHAEVAYTVYISDVMDVPIVNEYYGICCDEGVCRPGDVLTSVVQGPIFEVFAEVNPIAKKPGGGTGTYVTPTLVIRNVGAGNAFDAMAYLLYDRISAQLGDIVVDPLIGSLSDGGPECGDKCKAYTWLGDLGHGEAVTFTAYDQSTIGGEEGTPYTATAMITDALSNMTTSPVSGTAIGLVTHYANLVLEKSAAAVVGPGQLLTYTIRVDNRGMTTDADPVLTDVVPLSTTFVWASDGGITQTTSNTVTISWSLPALSPGEGAVRTFRVRVADGLVSGTQIINNDYTVSGYGNALTGTLSSGPPVTTTVQEVGLIHSFKVVTPVIALPGETNVLTYYLHIVNTSGLSLTGVSVYDFLPWEESTYQRDATAGAGSVISDIVSVEWTGSVGAFSSEIVTLTVLVDPDFRGAITNTAAISHADLLTDVVVDVVAYITDLPVLKIVKSASPGEVESGGNLHYTIRVTNMGQPATQLAITDVIPSNVTYLPDSATQGGILLDDDTQVAWEVLVLKPEETREFEFDVTVGSGGSVVNDQYAVTCYEGVTAEGAPVVTQISGRDVYLPLVLRHF